MSPGDAPYRGIEDPLGPHRARIIGRGDDRPGSPTALRDDLAAVAAVAGFGGTLAVAGAGALAVAIAGAALVAGAAAFLARGRAPRPIAVDVHDRGLRIADVALPWDDMLEVTVGFSPDQPMEGRDHGVVIAARGRPPIEVRSLRDDLQPVVTAIARATSSRLVAAAEDRLARDLTLPLGRHHLVRAGLRAGAEVTPWHRLGRPRRSRGQVIIPSAVGEFAVPLRDLVNPWVLEAIVAVRATWTGAG